MKHVLKWSVPFDDEIELELPRGAEILHIDTQTGKADELVMWTLSKVGAETAPQQFRLAGTRHPLPDEVTREKHIGTVLVQGYVCHLFRRGL